MNKVKVTLLFNEILIKEDINTSLMSIQKCFDRIVTEINEKDKVIEDLQKQIDELKPKK